jgi:chromate transporter
MLYLELFLVFMKIGFTSFGGMSMVPVINDEMLSHGWMSQMDISNILAIAEMTPGPLGINCATFAGMQVSGVFGGLIAVLGVLTPAFTTTLLAAIFFKKVKDTKIMGQMLYVIRPVCIGLILAVILTLALSSYLSTAYQPIYSNIIIGIIAFFLLFKMKKSVPLVIVVSAVLGLAMGMIGL